MKIAVIGAGASGLFVSGLLSRQHEVVVFEKNEKVAKKLFITGKGRCNITNLCSVDEFLKNVVVGNKFLRTALYSFNSQDCVDFFEDLGLKTKLERGNRIFPQSDKSSDVIKVLVEKHCKDVSFSLCNEVLAVSKKDNNFLIVSKKGKFEFDKVCICTGGVSYKSTGSDGAGYKFAKIFGHTIIQPKPALCPMIIKDKFISKLQGVSLKNVDLNILADGKKFNFFGEMIFTDKGISGPIVLTASSFVNRAQKIEIFIDFKPALSEKQLETRILRDFEENKNKELKSVIRGLLPKVVADVFASSCGFSESLKVNEITKQQRTEIVFKLKNFHLDFGGLYDIDAGIVTSGGVCTKEINPKTFESKLVEGLYFLGEALDIDALTGGFNLQIAWSTAYSCFVNFEK